jgi:hypothetical protein
MAWSDIFKTEPDHYTRPYGINNPKTTVLVISAEKEKDDERVKCWNQNQTKPKFIVIDKADLDPPEKLLELIKQHLPTHVILNFKHKNEVVLKAKKKGGKKRLELVKGNMGDITEVMYDEGYLAVVDVLNKEDPKNDNYLFLELQNVYRPTEGIYLMTDMTVTGGTWVEKVEKHVRNIKLTSGSRFNILVISGTHGGIDGKNKAVSGFTDKGRLEPNFYQEDLKSAEALEQILKLEQKFLHLKIIVKDMKELNKDEVKAKKPNSNHRKELIKIFEETKPSMVIMSWCYSTNGDVCMALRSKAVFSRMLLESDMRSMGIQKAKLNEKQVEVLKIAVANENVKVMALAGGTGSGKTVLGAEVVKIWMSKIIEKYQDVS